MDNQIAFDLLMKTALTGEIIGEDKEYRVRLVIMAKKLPPMQIGKYS